MGREFRGCVGVARFFDVRFFSLLWREVWHRLRPSLPLVVFRITHLKTKAVMIMKKKLCSHDKCFLKAWPCFMAEKKTGTLYYAYTYGAAEICVVAVIVLFFDILQQTFEEGSEFIEI